MNDIMRPSRYCSVTFLHGAITKGPQTTSINTKCSVTTGFTYVRHPDGEEVFVCDVGIHINLVEDAEALISALTEIVRQARSQPATAE